MDTLHFVYCSPPNRTFLNMTSFSHSQVRSYLEFRPPDNAYTELKTRRWTLYGRSLVVFNYCRMTAAMILIITSVLSLRTRVMFSTMLLIGWHGNLTYLLVYWLYPLVPFFNPCGLRVMCKKRPCILRRPWSPVCLPTSSIVSNFKFYPSFPWGDCFIAFLFIFCFPFSFFCLNSHAYCAI